MQYLPVTVLRLTSSVKISASFLGLRLKQQTTINVISRIAVVERKVIAKISAVLFVGVKSSSLGSVAVKRKRQYLKIIFNYHYLM